MDAMSGDYSCLFPTGARLFKLPPRNEKQRDNLKRHGNLAA